MKLDLNISNSKWGKVMRNRMRFLAYILLVCCLQAFVGTAEDVPFSANPDAIEQVANSILLLEVYNASKTLVGSGSGFVAFNNMTLITNAHVVRGAEQIIGISDDGFQYMITRIIAIDFDLDIAILEFFSPTDLVPLEIANENKLRRAEPVVAIGSPLGIRNSVSIGNVGTIFVNENIQYIQFTAPISPGSSGGTLLNDNGKVIGITTASMEEGQNQNIAINIEEVETLYRKSINNERVDISKYNYPDTEKDEIAPTVTPKPSKKPSPTKNPYEGLLDFGWSKDFEHSKLKGLAGYEFNKFDKAWIYSSLESVADDYIIGFWVGGYLLYEKATTSQIRVPLLIISDKTANDSEVSFKSIEVLIDDIVFSFDSFRYLSKSKYNFVYLGTIGKEMIQSISKAKKCEIRLTLKNGRKEVIAINRNAFQKLMKWSQNAVKFKVFESFALYQLERADKNHNAKRRE